jgi:hypothetical protein
MGSPSQMKRDLPATLCDRRTVRTWREQFQIAEYARRVYGEFALHL